MIPEDLQTIVYEERDGVACITLNRPEVLNAFDDVMQRELRSVYRALRRHDDVRVIVLTGSGDKAFCVGVDRKVIDEYYDDEPGADDRLISSGSTPFMPNDAGTNIGPKACDLWKPVIVAVNGIACGGAFYMLGEADIVIAAEHATFFDPHVTFSQTPSYESMHMLAKMPFHEVMRMALLGSHERMSARRAHEVGLVTEIVPPADLRARALQLAGFIAEAPAVVTQATVRALWAAADLSRAQALSMAYVFTALGNQEQHLKEGQERFVAGNRVDWTLR